MDISKVFTEAKIDVKSNECSHKQKGNSNDRYGIYCKRKRGTHAIIEKLRQLQGVLDIERTTG